MSLNSVDLPTPLRPTTPTLVPEGIATLAESKNRRPQASKTRLSIRSISRAPNVGWLGGRRAALYRAAMEIASGDPVNKRQRVVIVRSASDVKMSERLDRHHARHRLDGAGDLRRNLEASRQLHLDLVAVTEHQHHRHFAVG